MKHESNKSDIIVYDIHEDYSARTSSSSTKPADKGEEKHVSVPEQEHDVTGPTSILGGFTGKVYDKLTFRRVEGALVTIVKNLSVKTDEKGEFFITNIKPGKYRVTVSEEGYVVQSRKSTAVAGVTTKLESFHLIPDCLADDYPDDIEEENEGELMVEETAEPAVESIPSTSAEEISCAPEAVDTKIEEEEVIEIVLGESPEKTTMVSSDVVTVESVDRQIVADLEAREIITEENPIEYPETDVGEEALSALEETVEEPAGGDIVSAPVEKMEEISSNEIVSIPAEEIQTLAITKDSTEAIVSLPEEKDSTEAVISTLEEIDTSSVDVIPRMPVETEVVETVQPEETSEEVPQVVPIAMQPEEVPQELPIKEIQSRIPWMAWIRRKLKGTFIMKDPLELPTEVAPEVATQQVVAEETHEEEHLELSTNATPETAVQEMVVKETYLDRLRQIRKEGPSADVSLAGEIVSIPVEEIQTPVIVADSTEAAMSAPEEIVVGDVSSVDVIPRMPVETEVVETVQTEEAPQELSAEEIPIDTALEERIEEKTKEAVHQEELLQPPVETAPAITSQEEIVEEEYREEHLELSTEATPEFTVREIFIEEAHEEEHLEPPVGVAMEEIATQGVVVEAHEEEHLELSTEITPEVTVREMVTEKAHAEGPSAGVSVVGEIVSIPSEEIKTLAITKDSAEAVVFLPEEKGSTEAIMSAPEEIVVGDVSSIDVISQMPVETEVVETTQPEETSEEVPQVVPIAMQPEEVPQELPIKEVQSRLPWKRWVKNKNKVKRKFNRLDLLMPSPEDILKITAHQEVLEETLQAKPLKPSTSIEATPEITTQEEVVEGALQKEISADASVEEITEYRAMHEIITGFNKQNNFADAAAAIGGTEEEVCETIIGEKLLDHSESYIFTEDPVTPEGVPEGISDNDIASISEEERTAMSRDHNSVEMAGFIGIINAQPNPAYKGLPVNIAYTLRNVACDNPNDFIVQIIVVNPDTGIIYETFETPVKCRKGTFSMGGFVIFTTSYETYTYRLNMQIASEKTKTSHLLTGISLEIKSIF